MKFYNIINRKTFIKDDYIENIINGQALPATKKAFPDLISSLRIQGYNPQILDFYRSFSAYEMDNPAVSGVVFDVDKIKKSIDAPTTLETLTKDCYVSLICQLYINLDRLICNHAINHGSTEQFMQDVETMIKTRKSLQKQFTQALIASQNLTATQCQKIIQYDVKLHDCTFPLKNIYPQTQEFFKNNAQVKYQSLISTMKSLNNISRSIEK